MSSRELLALKEFGHSCSERCAEAICQEPNFTDILNFYFQPNSPTFVYSSSFSHDHSPSKQDKTFISDEY